MVKVKCEQCGKIKEAYQSQKRKFCSLLCVNNFRTGKKISLEVRLKIKNSLLKSGHCPPKQTKGEHNLNFKGKEAGYRAIHKYIAGLKGKAKKCSECGSTGERIQWANIDHKYSRKLDDYIEMCPKCHAKFDKKLKLRKNSV